MDLRKKASPIQILGGALLRFRLIFILVFFILLGIWGRAFGDVFEYAAKAGRALAEMVQNFDPDDFSAHRNALLLSVGFFAAIIAFRFGLGKRLNGISFLASAVLVPSIFSLSGMGNICPEIFWGGFFALALLSFFIVRLACFKALLPAFVAVYFWTALCARWNLPWEICVGFAVLLWADVLSVSAIAGRALSKGSPVSGALVGGFSGGFFPMLISNVFLGALFGLLGTSLWLWLLLSLMISCALYLAVEYPLLSVAPMSKMRASQRTMDLGEVGKGKK